MKPRNVKLVSAGAFALAALGVAIFVSAPVREACAAGPEILSYKDDVAPIFRGYCVSCHHPGGEGTAQSGLDLTTYAGLMKGSKFGPMVVPGSPETSNLMWLLDWRASPEMRMPHGKKKLPVCEREIISDWIRQGAKDN
ncbi:MAG TPA: c-type cytochrome domain-containing protein [Alphaproteobacteria bacterium]|nr:c-type cytochrome domain-containing protein [Alphaproteobacteria bacterium]